MEFLQGYLLGLGMIVFIGPVFFLLISVSLHQGTRAGVAVAIGIIVSDIICVSLCYYGVTSFLYQSSSKFWIALFGGILLILLGLKYLLKPSVLLEEKEIISFDYANCFVKGFLVNFVNPFVFFVWIGVVAYARESYQVNDRLAFYFLGALAGILNTDLLKVFTSRKIKPFLKPVSLSYLFRISGLVLIGFGIRMILLLV